MPATSENDNTGQKVFYRPIEAAIRWTGLLPHEQRIIQNVGTRQRLDPAEFLEWPTLHLNVERIVDALVNGDLAYGKNGVTCHDPTLLDSPDLTVRHVDLKAWMTHFYSNEKPKFLFNTVERRLCTGISADAVQTLLAEREALQIRLAEKSDTSTQLRSKLEMVRADLGQAKQAREPSSRSESTYLNIVAGLLTLLLGHSPSGRPYSSFNTQDAVISAMIAHYGNQLGISQSTLENKFAKAKRHIGPS